MVKHINERGFTLIELMIVVAIVGILAAAAIPSFASYLDKSKHTEAKVNLRAIGDGAIKYFNTEHIFYSYGSHFPSRVKGLYPGCEEKELDLNGNQTGCGSGTPTICDHQQWVDGPNEIGRKMSPSQYSSIMDNPPWNRLGFSISTNFYYCYTYLSSMQSFDAHAVASLTKKNDSQYQIHGNINGILSTRVDVITNAWPD